MEDRGRRGNAGIGNAFLRRSILGAITATAFAIRQSTRRSSGRNWPPERVTVTASPGKPGAGARTRAPVYAATEGRAVTLPLIARDASPAVLVTNDDIAAALEAEDVERYSAS